MELSPEERAWSEVNPVTAFLPPRSASVCLSDPAIAAAVPPEGRDKRLFCSRKARPRREGRPRKKAQGRREGERE